MDRWLSAALLTLAALVGCDDDGGSAATADTGAPADGATADAQADAQTDAGPGLPSPEVLADGADLTGFGADLEFIARERPPGSAHWQAVQDRCAEVFAAAGFTVERHAYGSGVNVIGVRPGTTAPAEWVVVSAHYDHIAACAGADDNASGTAGVLAAARALADTAFERTLVVACWDEEEWGLVGARAWAGRAKRQGIEVKASYVLESIGYFSDEPESQVLPFGFADLFLAAGRFVADRQNRGDFIAAISDDLDPSTLADFSAGAARVELPVAEVVLDEGLRASPSLGDLRRSDHAEFWRVDWPGIMLTTTANFRNPHYHCALGPDDIADLDMDRAFRVVQATVFAAARQARPAQGESQALDTTTDPMPPVAGCDLYAQDCGAGQKCMVLGTDSTFETTCVDDGAVGLGEICTRGPGGPGDDDCAAGHYCAFFSHPLADPQLRTCHAFCQDHPDCAEGEVCIELERSHHVGVCTPRCDPRDPAACGEGRACILRNGARPGTRTTSCNPASPPVAQRGEACALETPCVPGLHCLPGMVGGPTQCQPWCTVDADCGDGFRCQPTGIPDLGVCLPI